MIKLPVYNRSGEQIDTVEVDQKVFGSIVRNRLLKQAVVMYQANRWQGTVATKSRGMVHGSTRKLYRQKHTGRARMGSIRQPVRRGGGMAFAKTPRDLRQRMPKRARRAARNSALLAKMLDQELILVDGLQIDKPKTRSIVEILRALKIDGSCLVGSKEYDANLYLSVRNIPRIDVMPVEQFNTYDILAHKMMVITRDGFEKLQKLAGSAPGNGATE